MRDEHSADGWLLLSVLVGTGALAQTIAGYGNRESILGLAFGAYGFVKYGVRGRWA